MEKGSDLVETQSSVRNELPPNAGLEQLYFRFSDQRTGKTVHSCSEGMHRTARNESQSAKGIKQKSLNPILSGVNVVDKAVRIGIQHYRPMPTYSMVAEVK